MKKGVVIALVAGGVLLLVTAIVGIVIMSKAGGEEETQDPAAGPTGSIERDQAMGVDVADQSPDAMKNRPIDYGDLRDGDYIYMCASGRQPFWYYDPKNPLRYKLTCCYPHPTQAKPSIGKYGKYILEHRPDNFPNDDCSDEVRAVDKFVYERTGKTWERCAKDEKTNRYGCGRLKFDQQSETMKDLRNYARFRCDYNDGKNTPDVGSGGDCFWNDGDKWEEQVPQPGGVCQNCAGYQNPMYDKNRNGEHRVPWEVQKNRWPIDASFGCTVTQEDDVRVGLQAAPKGDAETAQHYGEQLKCGSSFGGVTQTHAAGARRVRKMGRARAKAGRARVGMGRAKAGRAQSRPRPRRRKKMQR